MPKLEHYAQDTNGELTKIAPETDTPLGRYKKATSRDILNLPSRLGKWGSARRIVVYPASSPKPYPLGAGEVTLAPEAYRARDVMNLEGGYWPNMLARALGLAQKMTPKDWIIIGLVTVNILLSCGAVYLAYKIAKYASLV
jgi:hypothetical protein